MIRELRILRKLNLATQYARLNINYNTLFDDKILKWLASDLDALVVYAMHFNRQVIDYEPLILSNTYLARLYASQFYRRRWREFERVVIEKFDEDSIASLVDYARERNIYCPEFEQYLLKAYEIDKIRPYVQYQIYKYAIKVIDIRPALEQVLIGTEWYDKYLALKNMKFADIRRLTKYGA